MSYARTTFARDGLALALHTWSAAAPHTVIVYIHGTQSHAGWLFETGPALARLGCVVYALDRRGSGESEGPRGHAESFRHWIDDYIAVMQHARAQHPSLPLLLDGQSFGGAIAVAVAGDPRATHDATILVTPLIVPRVGFDLWKDVADDVPVRLPAPDEWFTTQPRYLEFIRNDERMNRAVTRRFQQARLDLAQHYMALPAPLAGRPAALVVPRKDPMIDVASTRDVFAKLSGDTGIVVELPATDHYLDFTPAQEQLWRFKAAFARSVTGSGSDR